MMDMIEEMDRIKLLKECRAHELSVEAFAKSTKFPEPRDLHESIFIASILNSSRAQAELEIEQELEDNG
jgi:hypothetical protein